MNSKKSLHKLGRPSDHRLALKRNLLTSMVTYEYVKTTKAKAKMIIDNFDQLINIAKSNERQLAERRLEAVLTTQEAVAKVLDVLAPRLAGERSGYLKSFNLDRRAGDNAQQFQLMIKGYEYKGIGAEVKKKAAKKTVKKQVKDTVKKS